MLHYIHHGGLMINLNKEQGEKILETLNALEELDDVQNIFTNANLEKIQV